MLRGPSHTRLVAVARPAGAGGVPAGELTVSFACPARGVRAVGVGVAAEGFGEVRWLGEVPPSVPGPWFGGWAFDAERAWPGFDAERWIVPEVLWWWADGQPWLAAFADETASAGELLDRLSCVQPESGRTHLDSARCERSWPIPERTGKGEFIKLINQALEAIAGGAFEKLVVAREIGVEAATPFDVRAVLERLETENPTCWTFLVRGCDGRAFIGSTPEVLCEASNGVLFTDALAGTAGRGEADALLRSAKDRREHQAVIAGIRETLAPSCVNVEQGLTVVKTLANVVHLHTPLRARLKTGAEPLAVARALHPTPAVAGRPQRSAIDWLRAHELFSRGWYSGVVGMRGTEQVTLVVALRSALLDGASAKVFAGAGVVEGSKPEAEWLETERKAMTMLAALGVDHG